ncbi:stage V sporulation protein D [Caldanaerobacter subterraneus subsp. yonseiensis KB-1]|uniref:Cell division protein FtsI/penicillin-binding protein 2 n=3 Tax=Caldanaerobacter subterraneus TaxID=911092 RepID=Q8R9G1_CALS4|nr:Cell division protein FtsI/penicillin-binding protein 2 [Caldanaerobacter subterraneus subsp. tengcongensis MB4]ERM92797.1 stage V sporulation protein D [Caldanaerobacter subterraneus subsp. yonseiensis KB-1]
MLFLSFAVVFGLMMRLFFIQVVKGEEYQKMALPQWTLDVSLSGKRGYIFDRNGKVLAENASVSKISVIPKEIPDSKRQVVAETLASILGLDRQKVLERISNKNLQEVLIAKQVDEEKAKAILRLNIDGVIVSEDMKRFYPEGTLACHVLGFTGIDNQGLDGIELVFDNFLRGIPGKSTTPMDAIGRKIDTGEEEYFEPLPGYNVVLTIDETIQHFAEKALNQAMVHSKPSKGAVAIVMDPKTGEILALANRPNFDPNDPFEGPEEEWYRRWRNKAISDSYEPGSVFKTITASAALEEKVVSLHEQFYCPGYTTVAGHRINCWATHGSEDFVKGVQNSCNVVFVTVGQRLGVEKLYKYIRDFGFGKTTGILLPGEAPGLVLSEERVGPVELATNSFGQGIAVTPLQMITAVAAIANGGKLMQPQIVKAIVDSKGKVVKEFKPKIVRRVISKETSATMREILKSVVAEGTGKAGYIEGFDVAGKTGTTEKYMPGKYVASFVGFAPADDPKVIVLVVIDEPNNPETHFGSQLAAPVVKSILDDTLKYLEVQPRGVKKPETVMVPDVRNMKLYEAERIILENKLDFILQGNGDTVFDQVPKPGALVNENTKIILYLNGVSTEEVVVPDLKGKSVKEATEILNSLGLRIKIKGTGFAVDQSPKEGTLVKRGEVVEVEFRPKEN